MMVAGKSSCSVQCTTNVPLDSKDFFPESSCERFSQKNCCQFNFSFHLHNISYILYITYIIYINFICITYIIYIIDINFNQLHLHHIHYLHRHQHNLQVLTVYISPTKFLRCHLHRFFYTGVLTQELFHRSQLPGDLLVSEPLQDEAPNI